MLNDRIYIKSIFFRVNHEIPLDKLQKFLLKHIHLIKGQSSYLSYEVIPIEYIIVKFGSD